MQDPFIIREFANTEVPIIVSVPHCGVEFPEELKEQFIPTKRDCPDDTDWFVHDVYNFVNELGITMIHARNSRWVVDLNRDPESKPLYNDGRIITALTPTTDFFGEPIYANQTFEPDEDEVNRRLEMYYWPYQNKIQELIEDKLTRFDNVLLWDAHSIRHFVPTIREEKFPDMILGNNDEKTAHPKIISAALEGLTSGKFQINHNSPFKGGFITRNFGNTEKNVHSLQLEMNKILYMNDEELEYHPTRAEEVRQVLKTTFANLIETINSL